MTGSARQNLKNKNYIQLKSLFLSAEKKYNIQTNWNTSFQ
jgi:hypothetical protein